jgi:hypothetical protein
MIVSRTAPPVALAMNDAPGTGFTSPPPIPQIQYVQQQQYAQQQQYVQQQQMPGQQQQQHVNQQQHHYDQFPQGSWHQQRKLVHLFVLIQKSNSRCRTTKSCNCCQ